MKKAAQITALLFSIVTLTGCAPSGNPGRAGNESAAENAAADYSPEKAFDGIICSADEALKWAEKNPVAVSGENSSGHAVIESFFDTTNAGSPASVLCAKYYVLHPESMSAELYEAEKDQYPVLYFSLIEYDGKEYHVRTRDSSGTELDSDETYQHLVHLTGENPEGALTRYTDEYDLVDDPNVTFEQLQRSLFSSQSEDRIRHTSVFTDFHD